MAYGTSLITATANRPKYLLLQDSALRGHLIESAIGAYLLARTPKRAFRFNGGETGRTKSISSVTINLRRLPLR